MTNKMIPLTRHYDSTLHAMVVIDEGRRVRGIELLSTSDENGSRRREVLSLFPAAAVLMRVGSEHDPDIKVSYIDPRAGSGRAFVVAGHVTSSALSVVHLKGTYYNIPFAKGGVSLTRDRETLRFIGVRDSSPEFVRIDPLPVFKVSKILEIFDRNERGSYLVPGPDLVREFEPLADALELSNERREKFLQSFGGVIMESARFSYRERDGHERDGHERDGRERNGRVSRGFERAVLRPVDSHHWMPGRLYERIIQDKPTHYLALDVLLRRQHDEAQWCFTIDVNTGRIVREVEGRASEFSGMVWKIDPVSLTGDMAYGPETLRSALNSAGPFADNLAATPVANAALPSVGKFRGLLDGVDGDIATLENSRVKVVDASDSVISLGQDEDPSVIGDAFVQFSAYYHADAVFQKIEELAGDDYFTESSVLAPPKVMPLVLTFTKVDYNAEAVRCAGTDEVRINFGPPLGGTEDGMINRAVDCRSHWHEISHIAALFHSGSMSYDFSHSVGDSLAVLHCDPFLGERGVVGEADLGEIRYVYMPFSPSPSPSLSPPPLESSSPPPSPLSFGPRRRHDISETWSVVEDEEFSEEDDEKRAYEQILTTCHFRLYKYLGGDSLQLKDRIRASDQVMRMILLAIKLGGEAIETVADWVFYCVMADYDMLTGISGNRIRWAFESQGDFPEINAVELSLFDSSSMSRYACGKESWLDGGLFCMDDERLDGYSVVTLGRANAVKIWSLGKDTAEDVTVSIYRSEAVVGLRWLEGDAPLTKRSVDLEDVGTVMLLDEEKIWDGFLYAVADCPGDPALLIEGAPIAKLFPADDNLSMRCVLSVTQGNDETLSDTLNNVSFSLANYTDDNIESKRFSFKIASTGPDELDRLVEWSLDAKIDPDPDPDLAVDSQVSVKLEASPSSEEADPTGGYLDIDITVLLAPNGGDSKDSVFYGGLTVRVFLLPPAT